MKTIIRDLLWLAMVGAVASCAQQSQRWVRELPSTHPNSRQVHERLQEIVIPRIDFVNALLRDVVTSLCNQARDKNWGVNLVFSVGGDGPPPPPGSSGAEFAASEPKITIHGSSMRYLDVVDNICAQTGSFWWIDSRALVIASKEAYERSVAAAALKRGKE